jgi:diaminohydroxyphosphoribosylaminopyrimidine deaminase/5-amino-6-(5-phosphoribosylamino)uracil reductase
MRESECVLALIDPTSGEGGGAARLRAAGVDVEIGLLENESLIGHPAVA